MQMIIIIKFMLMIIIIKINKKGTMRKLSLLISLTAYFISFVFSLSIASEVNIFSARHYDSDVQLYEKFTAKTGIKVNVVSGKSGALEKRIIEEGSDSKADLYITADAGRLGSRHRAHASEVAAASDRAHGS